MDRRSFIKKCGGIAVTTSGCSSLLLSCQTIPSSKTAHLNTGQHNEITVNKAVLNTDGMVLQASSLKFPIFLHQQNGQYIALLMSCTHQQCTLAVTTDNLVCPCHGAKFDKLGTVLRGPAEKGLLALALYEKGNDIVISLP
mgnify:CR=1 FL=1